MEQRLYIVMREDLWDMNPGKGMSQSAHAQAEFDEYVENNYTDDDFRSAHIAWCEDRNFGVTLVLSAAKTEWMQISLGVEHYGYVNDPTYPYRNYYATCMWVFATTEEEIAHMQQWDLHK